MDGRGNAASENVYQEFFDAVVQGGLESVARTAYRFLGRPIAIGDETGAIILQLPEGDIDLIPGAPELDNWNELREHGTICQDDYLRVHADFADGGICYNEPVLVKDRFLSRGNQIITIFERHGSILTFATVLFGDDEPTEEDMLVIRVFARAIRPEIVRMRQFERTQECRLGAVLAGEEPGSPGYNVMLSSLSKRYGADYRVLYVVDPACDDARIVLARVCRSLNAGMLPCVATVIDGTLTVLAYECASNPKLFDQMIAMLANYPVKVGLSTSFEDLSLVRDYRFQAWTTLLSGRRVNPDGWLYRYEDLVPYQMCAATALGGSIDAFVHPSVMSIARYDRENGSEWIKTIEAYLIHHLNKGETAKALNIHPNTLSYRLGRIKDVFDVDFSDPKFLAAFYMSVMALRFSDSAFV